MKVCLKINDLRDFTPWSGAVDTHTQIIDEGKGEEFISMLENLYPDGIDEDHLNDLLWFESEWCLELVGIEEEEEEEEETI